MPIYDNTFLMAEKSINTKTVCCRALSNYWNTKPCLFGSM